MCQCSGQGNCSSVSGCVCDKGWEGTNCNKDIDECKQKPDVCPALEICENKSPGFACLCPGGYERKNGTCTDINECENIILNNCDVNKENCYNYNGNYTCNCKDGLSRNSIGQCQDCLPGTWGLDCARNCSCSLGASTCNPKTGCVCKDGYNGTYCSENINQCGQLNCSQYKNQDCVERYGPDLCACKTGFANSTATGQCENINECALLNNCSQKCTDTEGSFYCSCLTGFNLTTDSYKCEDIDECKMNLSNCKGDCINTAGYFKCTCSNGFQLSTDGFSCEDVNECSLKKCPQDCINTVGSYNCSCYSGYQLVNGTCQDIDECSNNSLTCQQNCSNLEGSFKCSCFNDYHNISNTCQKIMSKFLSIRFQYNGADIDFINKSHESYVYLKDELQISLYNLLKVKIKDLISVSIDDLRNGSIIVDFVIVTKEISQVDYANAIYETIHYIFQINITIGNQSLSVIDITVDKITYRFNATQCMIYQDIVNCTCEMVNGIAQCKQTSSGSSDIRLILGLAIGIPLFVIFTACVVAALCIWKKRRGIDYDNSIYSFENEYTGMSTKSFKRKEDDYLNLYNAASPSDYEMPDRYQRLTAMSEERDYTPDYTYLEVADKNFHIQRPKLTPTYSTKL
ncbi:hypothetical protein Btru_047390 [Bulinus truncatus]|nr:hypothetical protein Btru_047390 [Bulinus truncatus]